MAERATLPPALFPAAGIAGGIVSGWYLPVPVAPGPALLLVLIGLALGEGRWRHIVVACGLGALSATAARDRVRIPDVGVDRVVTADGRVCGHAHLYPEGGASLALCVVALRVGADVAPGRWLIRLDLAPGIDPPAFGARLRVRGGLARAPGYDNAFRSPPGRWALRVKAKSFLTFVAPPPTVFGWISRARGRLEQVWEVPAGRGSPGVSLARALVLGDAQALPLTWQRALRRAGLAHLVAVSGLNVALVVGAVLVLSAPLPRAVARSFGALAAGLYLVLVGPEPSLVRATWMSLAVVAALFSRRSPASLNTLALVAGGMLLWRPEVVEEVGFRLSVAATAGLIGLAPRVAAALPVRPAPLAQALAASLAAQIAALPFAVAAFGRVPLAAPLLNLLFVPATALGLGAGLVSGALGIAWGAGPAAWPMPLLELAALPYRSLEFLPWTLTGSVPVPPTLVAGLALALCAWSMIVAARARRVTVMVVALLAAGALPKPAEEVGAEMALLDVGQGDAILLQAHGTAILVDGGGARGRDLATSVLLPALARRGVGELDAMVLTHADQDHCGGLADLSGWLPIREVWLPVGLGRTECSREVARAARIRWLERGERIELGSLEIEVLHPGREIGTGDNAVSLVLEVTALGRRLLLTGDLDGAGEHQIAERLSGAGRIDLLKVAHHGSASSTTEVLLDAARPRLALVSAGPRNLYGHPSTRVLARLADRGIPVLRTDRDGEISIRWRRGAPLMLSLPGSPRRSPRDPPR